MNASVGDYAMLTKPRLVLMAASVSSVSFYMASTAPLDFQRMGLNFLGSFLVGASAAVLNQVLEKNEDRLMERTRLRPLPAGRMRPFSAAVFGAALAVLGLSIFAGALNLLSAAVALLILVAYLAVYTPLKKITVWNTLVGAFPGALPCLLGWTAATGRLDPEGFTLFWILYLWQLPHFFSIAWVYREDYRAAGFRMLPAVDESGRRTAAQIVFFSAVLALVSLIPARDGWAGPIYLVSAAAAGGAMVVLATVLAATQLRFARGFVSVSIYYLILIVSGLAVDRL